MVSNPPAFPREDYQADDAPGQRGMTLRDWFAGQALTGLLSDSENIARHHRLIADREKGNLRTVAAAFAYQYADAMLAARVPEPGL